MSPPIYQKETTMNYNEANEYIKAKVLVPTTLDSKALAIAPNFSAQIKAHCFFSAKVSGANVLEALKKEVENYTSGKTDVASARLRLKTFLKRQGVMPDTVTDHIPEGMDPDDFKARKAISHLASTRRLNMILELNAKMAQATARRVYDHQPIMLKLRPNYRYDALDDARGGHLAFDGMILNKESEFWYTHTPPWEYGCRCAIYGTDKPENSKVHNFNPDTGAGKLFYHNAVELLPNKSGFNFRIDSAFKVSNMSMVNSPDLRLSVLTSLHKLHEHSKYKITVTAGVPTSKRTRTVLPENIKEIEAYFDDWRTLKRTDDLPVINLSMGTLLPQFAKGLGLTKIPLTLTRGKERLYGLEHWRRGHMDNLIDGSAIKLLKKTLWNRNAVPVVTFTGGKQRLSIYHPESYEFCTCIKVGEKWQLELVSAEKYDHDRVSKKVVVGYKSKRKQR